MTDYVVFPVVLLFAVGFGFGIGRWWALTLVLLVPLGFPLYEPDSDGAPRWFYPTLFLGPPVLLALTLGVIARKLSARRSVGAASEPAGDAPVKSDESPTAQSAAPR